MGAIQPDYTSGQIYQRASRKAGIESDISVNDSFDLTTLPGAARAIERANRAEGYSGSIRTGPANGNHQISNFCAFSDLGRHIACTKLYSAKTNGRQIGAGIASDELSLDFGTIRKSDGNVILSLNHMVGGKHDGLISFAPQYAGR
jgi:hypothetical protein